MKFNKSNLLLGKLRRVLPILLIFLFGGIYAANPGYSATAVKVGIYQDFPLVFADSSGNAKGAYIDVLEYIADKEAWSLEYVACKWADCLAQVEDGDIDILTAIAYSKERAQKYDFNEETFFPNWGQVYSAQNATVNSINDLSGKSVAGLKDDIYFTSLKELAGRANLDIAFVDAEEYEDVFRLIEQEAVNAGILPRLFGALNENRFDVKKTTTIIRPSELRFAAPKNSKRMILAALDDHLRELKADRNSLYFQSISKWLGQKETVANTEIEFTEAEREWLVANPSVKVVHYFHEPPFTLDSDHAYSGYLYDLLLKILHIAGLKYEFVNGLTTYDSMVDALQNGTADILTTMNNTRQLPNNVVRSVPVVKTPYVLVAKLGTPDINRTADLFGRKVAVVLGYAQDQHLDQFPQIEKIYVQNNNEGFDSVRTGRAEYFLNNRANAGYVLKKTFATDLRIAGTLSYVDFPPLTLAFGIHGGNSLLPGIFNKALAAVPMQTLSALREKWLPEEVAAKEPRRIDLSPDEEAFLKAHPVIRVHNEQNWAPFNFFENGSPTGFSIDYMNLLAEKIGIRVEYASGPSWNEFISMIKDRRLDVMLNIVKTKEREKFIRFTEKPYLETPRAIVVRKDDTSVQNFSDLYGRTVAVEKGFFYENYLKQNHPEINVITVKDTVETLRAVTNGDADAALGVIAVEQFLIDRHFFSNLKLVVDPGEKALRSFNQFIGVRSDWPLLADVLDKAMESISDKERVNLSRKWISQGGRDSGRIQLSQEEGEFLRGHPVLQFAYDLDWPPVESADKKHGTKGMAADYLTRMCELLGIEIVPGKPRPWKEMMNAVKNGELDFLTAVTPTPQRRRWMNFTASYLSFPIVILTDKAVPYVGSLSELRDKPVAVVDGYAPHDLLMEHHPELTLLPVRDVKEGLLTVSTGKAFAFVGSLAAASHVMSREGVTGLKVSGETPYSYDLAMGVHKDNTILLNILNKALAAISPQERNDIGSRWAKITYEYKTDYSTLGQISAIMLIIIASILYWNGRLKKEVFERKQAEQAADKANQAKSEFLANMSHELRTPLNAILGFAQIMERNPNISSEREHLNIIQRSGTHLLTLINQVLDLSKIEAGHLTLEEHDFDLSYLLSELENMLSLEAENRGLSLKFECSPEVPRFIRADKVKLRQVLINLLNNAIKFTVKGSVTARITKKDQPDKDGHGTGPHQSVLQGKQVIHFEIEDTGPGIAPEEMTLLFEAFGQTASGRETREGTGLGLLISHRFVQLMGGEMLVDSTVGQGTTFSFDVLAGTCIESDTITTVSTHQAIAVQPEQPQFKMLVVDDMPDNRRLLVSLLSPFGFELREAANGQEAFDIWQEWKPHLIWLDMRMPVMSGFEVAEKIRELGDVDPHPVIIAVTASVFEDKRSAVVAAGCDDIVIKPFKIGDIVEMLQKHLSIKFIYDDKPGEIAEVNDAGFRLSKPDISELSDDLVMRLKASVASLEIDSTLLIIEEIRAQNQSLAEALKKLVEGYRFDKVQELLESDEQI
jgi:ABC-type amino acid transport substrate-binding protein/CheY-like chemotaxis protein